MNIVFLLHALLKGIQEWLSGLLDSRALVVVAD